MPARKGARAHAGRALAVPTVLLGLAGGLAGCSTSTPESTGDAELACPRVRVVRDAATVTQFRSGAGRDLTDVVSRATVADFAGKCDYDREGVTVDLDLFLAAERGPAMAGAQGQGTQGNYRYFVAIADPARTVLAKQEFTTTVEFAPDAARAGTKEELRQKIPLPEGRDARRYEILVGFQLTPEQLDWNRKQGR